MFRTTALTVALGLAASTTPVAADIITIGGTGAPNAFPFGAPEYVGEYQQIYASNSFPGRVTISEIDFSSATSMGVTRTLNLAIGLSTTTATPGSPGTNYAANKGLDFTTVFSGTKIFTATSNSTFDLQFPITPFTYDPVGGNLLLDVVINSSSGSVVFFQFGSTPNTGRIYNNAGSGSPTADPSDGLLTEFTVTRTSSVPAPPAVVLVGLGAGCVALRRYVGRHATA
jgi:hypothetical protein